MTEDGVLAHGIGGEAADANFAGFVQLGFEHMLLGWDHLLFIAGVMIICRDWKLSAKMITLFVLGHSTTLILFSIFGWGLAPSLVDLVIAMSVLFVGFYGISRRPVEVKRFGMVVLGFGLIHGMGLAARLDEIGLPEQGMLLKVIAFNIGIEIGQLTAVLAFATLGTVWSMLFKSSDRSRMIASGAVMVGGTAALVVVLLTILNPPLGEPTRLALAADSSCELTERTRDFGNGIGEHPDELFTEPTDSSPMGDFGHVLADGFVIVLYPQDLPSADLDTLRAYVIGEDEGEFVLAGPNPEASEQIEVHNLYETLSCPELEMATVMDYRNDWIASVEDDLS